MELLFCNGPGRIAFHFDIISLQCTRRAAAVGDELFQKCLHLGDFLRHRSGQVLRFTEIIGEVVELHGLRLITTFAPAS